MDDETRAAFAENRAAFAENRAEFAKLNKRFDSVDQALIGIKDDIAMLKLQGKDHFERLTDTRGEAADVRARLVRLEANASEGAKPKRTARDRKE